MKINKQEWLEVFAKVNASVSRGDTVKDAVGKLGINYNTYTSAMKRLGGKKSVGKKVKSAKPSVKMVGFAKKPSGGYAPVESGKVEIRLANGVCVSCGVEELKEVLEVVSK